MQNGHGKAILLNLSLFRNPYTEYIHFWRHTFKEWVPNYIFVYAAAHMSHRNEDSGGGDHSHMNGHVELKRSCRVRKSQFEHLNQSLLFDQLVNR